MIRLQDSTATSACRMRDLHTFLRTGTALLRQCRNKQLPLGLALLDTRCFTGSQAAAAGAGGELARMVVRRLAALAGERGLAGRTAAHEYALLLPGQNERQALRLVGMELGDLLVETIWGELESPSPAAAPYLVADIAGDARSLEAWLDDLRSQLPGGDRNPACAGGQWNIPSDDLPATIMLPLGAR